MPNSDDERPLTPVQARVVARMRWLMLISGFATVLGIAVVLGVVGYRIFHSGSANAGGGSELTVLFPKGAKIVATSVSGDALIVTIEVGGTTEIRSFDARTLRPLARLRFATEP
jgi:hypothetical protein